VLPAFLSLSLLLAASAESGPPAEIRAYQSLHLETPYTPPIARIEGEDRLVYELHATNFSSRTLAITAIEVADAASGATLARIDPAGIMRRIGAPEPRTDGLAPGQRAIFYLSVPWSDRPATPIFHRISFDAAREGEADDRVTIAGGEIAPMAPRAYELGAPLRGGPWTAVALPDHDNGHRRFPYAVRGRVRLPGRHAIDWMPARGFDPASAGVGVAADGSGAEVLAVADGEIVAAKEPSVPGARPDVEDETGATVVLRLPDGRYAHYQHLAPGLAVTPGMRVRRGQAIARVGSTGHVTQPHLHFHVADGVTPLDSEGLPYRLDAGRIVGRYADFAEFIAGEAWQSAPPRPIDGLPDANAVILFDSD
jgi:murein DD-endopeptidase